MNVPRPRGSANRESWQTELMPRPTVLSDVPSIRQRSLGASRRTWSGLSSIARLTGFSSGPGFAAAGSSTCSCTTNRPPTRVTATSATTPPRPCSRRRRCADRRMSWVRGGRSPRRWGPAARSRKARRRRGVRPLCRRLRVAAVSLLLDARRSRPSRRCVGGGVAARWESRSTLRRWSGRRRSASSTPFCSALRPFSRCHNRATCRRGPSTRREDAPNPRVGEPVDPRQWCPAASKERSRTGAVVACKVICERVGLPGPGPSAARRGSSRLSRARSRGDRWALQAEVTRVPHGASSWPWGQDGDGDAEHPSEPLDRGGTTLRDALLGWGCR